METEKIFIYKIDEEFQKLVLPLSKENYAAIEEKIKRNVCDEPVFIWNKILVTGNEIYELCHKYGVSLKTKYVPAKSHEDVIIWLCRTQAKRSDITNEMKRYLIGKMSIMECIMGAHFAATAKQNKSAGLSKKMKKYETSVTKIREHIAQKYHLNCVTVQKYEMYANAIDRIYKTDNGLAKKILLNNIKISQERIIEISQSVNDINNAAKQVLNGGLELNVSCVPKISSQITFDIKNMGLIKEMPKYDPDAEIESLSLTIPSWASSIKRIQVNDFSKVSVSAKHRLVNELEGLENMIEKLVKIIKESNNGKY